MEKKKVGFASGIGFILAAAGSAVGLGNLWGFPYKTSQNGGAAFVLIYIACVLLIGFVTMLSEIYLGRRAQANPMTAYKMIHKNLGWCGLVAIMIPAFIICYYSVLGGWTTKYALNSFSGNAGIVGTFSVNTGEVILYTAIFLVLSMVIIMGGVKDGIEKASKVLMPVLFLILVAIAVYALTLGSGVREGLQFYLKPDFSGITFKSVLVAMGQAFYSLSLGMGIMITYGSYTGKEVNLARSSAMICIFDTLVALIAGLAIFPSVAHFDPALLGSSKGVALMFIILPQVFESMGGVGQVVSFAFFIMVDIAAITSVVSLIEVVTQFVIQKFHAHRKRAALIVAGVCFVVSIPIGISLGHVAILEEASPALFGLDWLTFFDEVTNTVLMPVCALFSCIVVGWFITPRRAVAEIEAGGTPMSGWLKKVYAVMIRFVTPALILIVEIGGLQSEIAAGNVAVVVFAFDGPIAAYNGADLPDVWGVFIVPFGNSAFDNAPHPAAEQRRHQKQRQHVVELILSLFGVLRHHRTSLRHAAGFSPALRRHPHGAPFGAFGIVNVDEVIADAVKLLPHELVTMVGAQRKQQAGMPVDELPVAGVHELHALRQRGFHRIQLAQKLGGDLNIPFARLPFVHGKIVDLRDVVNAAVFQRNGRTEPDRPAAIGGGNDDIAVNLADIAQQQHRFTGLTHEQRVFKIVDIFARIIEDGRTDGDGTGLAGRQDGVKLLPLRHYEGGIHQEIIGIAEGAFPQEGTQVHLGRVLRDVADKRKPRPLAFGADQLPHVFQHLARGPGIVCSGGRATRVGGRIGGGAGGCAAAAARARC